MAVHGGEERKYAYTLRRIIIHSRLRLVNNSDASVIILGARAPSYALHRNVLLL